MRRKTAKLTFGRGVPAWMKRRAQWCKQELLPEWDVKFEVVSELEDEDQVGEAEYYHQYLDATLKVLKSLKDDAEGHIAVIHEFLHPYMAIADEALDDADTPQSTKASYKRAEENIVTRLSRLLYELSPRV